MEKINSPGTLGVGGGVVGNCIISSTPKVELKKINFGEGSLFRDSSAKVTESRSTDDCGETDSPCNVF